MNWDFLFLCFLILFLGWEVMSAKLCPIKILMYQNKYSLFLKLSMKTLICKFLYYYIKGREKCCTCSKSDSNLVYFPNSFNWKSYSLWPKPIDTLKNTLCLLNSSKLPRFREEYPEHGPSILSDAWLAIHGSRELHIGSTWEWNSTNYSQNVPNEEASKAMEELVPKALAVYPGIKNWNLTGARAGLRAMPPLTSHGSLPLLGRVDDFVGGNECEVDGACKFWLFTGLGSRGLLYHGWLGKVLAQAVLTCNEDLIPCELLEWRSKIKRWNCRICAGSNNDRTFGTKVEFGLICLFLFIYCKLENGYLFVHYNSGYSLLYGR